MASRVAKFQIHDLSDGPPVLDVTSSSMWSMEEDDLADQLKDDSFKKRVEVLDQLIITVKRNGGRLPYADGDSIFRSLGLALADSNWEIRTKCMQLLQEIIPNLGDEIDTCMSLVLSKMIANIGDSKVTVRRMVVQALHAYMKHTHNLPALFDAIVNIGLENDSPAVRREMITALPMLLTKEFVNQELSNVITSLAKKLLDTSVEDNLKDCSLSTLNTIENMVGERMFSVYLKNLSLPIQKYYLQLSGRHDIGYYTAEGDYYNNGNMVTPQGMMNDRTENRRGHVEESYQFGIVPSHILIRLNDQKDFRTRAQAVEDLKSIVLNTTNYETCTNLMPYMGSFINFLSDLLDDSNFKIINVTLEIFLSLVEKMEKSAHNFLEILTCALLKRMGDNKIVIRQLVMSIVIKMMQSTSPMDVISVLKGNLQHKNSRVRQETINFIIAALLTFPSKDFDIPAICKSVGPTLTDVKRAVRQAALECFATLAQVMGPGQLQPLVSAVDEVELCTDGEGLMAAVQARLARKQLPKLTSDRLVEYATQTPTSATVRSSSSQQSADTEWIMAVSAGVSGSARTSRSDVVDLGFVTTSTRSTPTASSDISTLTSVARPFMSAGRGRNKLPWEDNRDERTGHYSNMPNTSHNQVQREVKSARAVSNSEDGPPKPRHTWTGDEEQYRPVAERQQPRRRTTVMGILSPDDSDSNDSHHQQRKRSQGPAPRAGKPENVQENGYNRQESKPLRSFLDPISGDVDDPVSPSVMFKSDENESPVPGKAALARGSVTRKKVPPISLSSESFDDSDSAYAPSEEGKSAMNGSLKSIRNSATKKRADKLFEKLEKQSSQQGQPAPSRDDQLDESAVFSAVTHSELSIKSSVKKPDHRPSYETSNNNGKPAGTASETADSTIKGEMGHVDYSPTSGITFHEHHSSDVEVVGKGYGEDASDTPVKVSSSVSVSRLKERRRLNNRVAVPRTNLATLVSKPAFTGHVIQAPIGVTSMHLPASIDPNTEDKSYPGQDSMITLVGRGVFDSSVTAEHSAGTAQSQDGRLKLRKNEVRAPAGVVGVSMRSTADMAGLSPETSGVDEEWEQDNISMTQSLKDKVAVKQQQRLEEDERRRAEKERKAREEEEKRKQEREEKLKKERERQQEKLKRLSSAESINAFEFLSISGSGSGSTNIINSAPNTLTSLAVKPVPNSPKLTPPAVTPRRTLKTSNEPVLSFPMPVESSLAESDNPDDWKPFKDSDAALRDLLKKMEHDDWETKCEGINMLRRLSMHHADTVLASLHQIVLAITGEVQNLRSQVSRLAIKVLADMFFFLKKQMDPEVDLTTKVLLAKGGESNQFIREDVDKALIATIDNVTPQRALGGLITGGASHKNSQIRKLTAQLLVDLVERMGSGRILSGVKDITDKVLPTAAQFVMDGSQETRYFGRKIFYMLMAHQDFDRMLARYLPASNLRNIQDIVDTLRQKGLGEHPSEVCSARSRRSGQGSRSNSAVREASANSSVDTGGGNQPPKHKALIRTNDAHMEEVNTLIGLLAAKNWQERHDGVSSFLSMCETNPVLVYTHKIKIFDKFLPRLQDSNSKVNLYALKVMLQVTPILKDNLSSVIGMTVGAVAPNLSSKNKEIYSTAAEILEAFIDNLDLSLLVQPFSSQAINATSRSKADLVLKVAYLVEKVYYRKQKQVVLHVLPLLWHLLGSMNTSGTAVHGGSGDVRQATSLLVSKLYECMGQGLLEKASAEPVNSHRQIQMLENMIEDS